MARRFGYSRVSTSDQDWSLQLEALTKAGVDDRDIFREKASSGRIEARTGLRMMPTFPRSPRSFRTAGFPQYGWKAGLSGGAFPDRQRLKPAPGMRLLTAGLPSPFVHLRVGAVVPYCAGPPTGRCTAMEGGSPSAPGALARVRVMLSRSVVA